MKPVIQLLLITLLLSLLCQCAGVNHTAILTEDADRRATGIRYYDTSPYLFVRTDNEGGLSSELVYLPDLTKKRSAKPFAILAKNDAILTWDDTGSALTGSSSDVDTTAVPAAVIGALETAATSFIGAAFDEGTGERQAGKPALAPEAYLFKVVKQNGKWGLIGTSTKNPEYRTIQ